ncbi:hypothetical protein GF389_01230 [Candidatus Dojkabacteria bacterium]|nr:hypothetical protein [Candidatus Dojkabacteria bacterium]
MNHFDKYEEINRKDKEISGIIAIKPDGSFIVTQQKEYSFYKGNSEETVVGEFWGDLKRQ